MRLFNKHTKDEMQADFQFVVRNDDEIVIEYDTSKTTITVYRTEYGLLHTWAKPIRDWLLRIKTKTWELGGTGYTQRKNDKA